MKERVSRGIHWWYLDKRGRLFMSTGHSATHVKKGDGHFFMRRWFHKVEHKRIFISVEEQKKIGLKRITRKEAERLKELNDTPCVKDWQKRMGFVLQKDGE